MLKPTVATVLITSLTLLASGCASTQSSPNAPQPVDATTLQTSIAAQNADIAKLIEESKAAQQQSLTQVNSQLAALQTQVASIKTPTNKPEVVVAPPVAKPCPESPIGSKYVLGEVEHVYINEIKAGFDTRIDTGAESSSLDARNIILFERDGKQWVRFDVLINGDDAPGSTYEAKVVRFVKIKQNAGEEGDRRPVIHAHLKIGKYAAETDLNLTDRSHLDYPLLLGRKFMKDIAVVDVGHQFLHGKGKTNSAPTTKEQEQ